MWTIDVEMLRRSTTMTFEWLAVAVDLECHGVTCRPLQQLSVVSFVPFLPVDVQDGG